MKVLFLDIDGVLNKMNTRDVFYEGGHMYTNLDQALVNRFRRWLEDKEDLNIVLSSTWRFYPKTRKILNDEGIFWEGVTPINRSRGMEIHEWLLAQEGPISEVAIIDDNPNMWPVGRYFVQTSETHGLLDKHLKRLDKLLGYAAPDK
jgi:hypothetical protein